MTSAVTTRHTTFARLHEAHPRDADDLCRLSEKLPGGIGGERPVWQTLLQAIDAHIFCATECQLLVGAIVLWHHRGAGSARLAWLGVDQAARRRGVGRLLLETGLARVGSAGAMVVSAHVRAEMADMPPLLSAAGFFACKGPEWRVRVDRR
ncbi:hypothetical protein DMC47_11975 [Nostoc sp. 3335mG]|nr:hypothetical protein DMC47_11975 [Nostoc sp. 3335mG]